MLFSVTSKPYNSLPRFGSNLVQFTAIWKQIRLKKGRNSLQFSVYLHTCFCMQKMHKFYSNSEEILHVYGCLNDFYLIVSHLKDSKSISDQFCEYKWLKRHKKWRKKWLPRLRPDIYLLSAGEKVLSLKSGKGEFLELEIKSKVLWVSAI